MTEQVDVVARAEYWYPDEGGQVWIDGLHLVDADGAIISRYDPALTARGLHVTHVAGAGAHHSAALQAAALPPGAELQLRRDAANPHDPNAIRIFAPDVADQVGWVPRELAAVIAPRIDAGVPWRAIMLREQRRSPRDPRTGITLLLADHEIALNVRPSTEHGGPG